MNARLSSLLLIALLSSTVPVAANTTSSEFRRLSAAEIKAVLIGHEFTDETHWFYRFKRDGSIEGASMGRHVKQRWKLIGNRLCVIEANTEDDCREVWKAQHRLELRRTPDDQLPHAGVLRP